MPFRTAVLDDYQNVALSLADWSAVTRDADVTVFTERFADQADVIRGLADFDAVVLMRERTPFPRAVFEGLPKLKLVVTSGMRNAAIDLDAARERGVVVSGTDMLPHPTAELTFALMLELARKVGYEASRMKAGVPWQSTVGFDLRGKTLGLLGLGKLGAQVARIAQAFGMTVVAWSPNLTEERAREAGVGYASKEVLLGTADIVSIHLVLGPRSRGLVGAAEFALMKPSARLINTSRGPIVDEAALIDALRVGRIAGAAVDVYDTEPLPPDHPLRSLPNAVATPHLGYVTQENYRLIYTQTVENIRSWMDGKPIRVIGAG